MDSSPAAPGTGLIAGHWYLVGGTAGFLDVRPRVLGIEVTAEPLSDERILLRAAAVLPTRVARISQHVRVSSARGTLSYGILPGSAFIMRKWKLGISPDGTILRVEHEGSMLIGGGVLLYARFDVSEERARSLVVSHAARLELTERAIETMVWRARPDGLLTPGQTRAPSGSSSGTRISRRLARLVRRDTPSDRSGPGDTLVG